MQLESQIPPPIAELDFTSTEVKKGASYTWEKKYSVVAAYLATGNMRLTAKKTGVNAQTIENWRKSNWWPELVAELKNTDRAELNNKINKLVNIGLNNIEDQLVNGEQVLNQKTGELVRKPVSARDTTNIVTGLMQRQEAINKNELEKEIGKATTQEILKSLAQEFANFNKNKTEVVDLPFVEVVNAIHDEREA